MNLLDLPLEINYKILSEVSLTSLSSLYTTNKYFYNICNDELFWKQKFLSDYSSLTRDGLTWRQSYIKMYNSKIIPIYISKKYIESMALLTQCEKIDQIYIQKKDTFDIVKIIASKYYDSYYIGLMDEHHHKISEFIFNPEYYLINGTFKNYWDVISFIVIYPTKIYDSIRVASPFIFHDFIYPKTNIEQVVGRAYRGKSNITINYV